MTVVDPIADMLTRIRNAMMALHKEVKIPKSKMKVAISQILLDEGYIKGFETEDRYIKITLKYVRGKSAIEGLKRASRPGWRQYVGVDEIPKVQNGLGINVLSTSQGVVEGNQAKHIRIGGELLCQIW